jgi:hypothetical protein
MTRAITINLEVKVRDDNLRKLKQSSFRKTAGFENFAQCCKRTQKVQGNKC